MHLREVRPIGAWAVVCALALAGCNCGDKTMTPTSLAPGVQALGGVSCHGEEVKLSVLVVDGQPPFTFKWSPTDGLSDPTSDAPTATVTASRTYSVEVTDA